MVRYGGVSPSYKFVPNSLSFPLNVYDKLIFWVHIDFTICAYIVTLTPSFFDQCNSSVSHPVGYFRRRFLLS